YHKIMEPIGFLHLQMRLEGKEVVQDRFIRQVEIVPGEDTPLMLIASLVNGNVVAYYDEALSANLQETLAARIAELIFPTIDPLLDILKTHDVPFEVGHYKTYVFPSIPVNDMDVRCLSKDDSRVEAFGFDDFAEQVYVVERDGRVVSACVSARENETCGEAWVFTAPEYRHQGFAQKVVNAWARSLMSAGRIPFYSHKVDNRASAHLAGKIGLQPVFEEISITRN
ncbi:MAG TPA: GNAT family N-acetyltransferase, partial [Anaerolineales bacterium]|nr:GNAT family N-acetyltransferase [Anaerolineales bacterium]